MSVKYIVTYGSHTIDRATSEDITTGVRIHRKPSIVGWGWGLKFNPKPKPKTRVCMRKDFEVLKKYLHEIYLEELKQNGIID
jgi:hypothetical protein